MDAGGRRNEGQRKEQSRVRLANPDLLQQSGSQAVTQHVIESNTAL